MKKKLTIFKVQRFFLLILTHKTILCIVYLGLIRFNNISVLRLLFANIEYVLLCHTKKRLLFFLRDIVSITHSICVTLYGFVAQYLNTRKTIVTLTDYDFEKMNKEKILSIRIKPKNFVALEAKAKTHHMTKSNYARALIRSDLKGIATNQEQDRVKKNKEKYDELEKDHSDLLKFYEELSRKTKEEIIFLKNSSKILINLFEESMKNSTVMSQIRKMLTGADGKPSEEYNIIMNLKKKLEGES